ncbi:MAG: hypothetical protein HQL64_05625 [Magnetococcales bacterium]|nr:hypothetical protein [Magnetococcales bacterium]
MPQRIFFCITNHNLVAHPWENDMFGEATIFDQGGEDLVRFAEYLNTIGNRFSAYILIDLTEEELKLERIPRLNPFNRTRMLENRSSRLMRNTPFRYVTLLGRDPRDKEQDCVLFSGLTDPEETVTPWLDLLSKHRVALVGVWSIPLLTTRVFRDVLDPEHSDVLLLSINSGGLRQTFVRNGQILISRLSRLHTGEAEELFPFLLGEVSRMQGYLASQRLYVWSSALHVYVLCSPALLSTMQSGPKEVGSTHFHPVDVTRLAAQVGLKNTLTTGKMDRLFGQCIMRWSIPNHYARTADTIVFRTLRLRKQMQWVAAGLFAISFTICLIFFLQGRSVQDQQPELSRQAEEIQQATRQTPHQHSFQEGSRIINAVNLAESLQGQAADPRATYALIGQLLIKNDTLLIDNMEWSVEENAPHPGNNPRPPQTPQPPKVKQGTDPLQLVQLTGRVHSYTTLRDAMRTMEQFIQELRALPDIVEVQPVQLPMNMGQNAVIQGGDAPSEEKAVFNLKVLVTNPKSRHEKQPH